MTAGRVASSFRDPSGFLFTRNGTLHRQVQPSFAQNYDLLNSSGLYEHLVRERLLIPHEELSADSALEPGAHRVLLPEQLPVVSFAYEWCFSQLKAAAELTLRIQEIALGHGMTLKDASAFNVQFRGTAPVFVDTLSFVRAIPGEPWVAYRQFAQHFLAPLALQAMVDVRLRSLSRKYLDGIPLDLASKLLPRRTWFLPWALAHIHLHARAIASFAATGPRARPVKRSVSSQGVLGLVRHLRKAIRSIDWKPAATEWGDYESSHGYDATADNAKRLLVGDIVTAARPRRVVDLGANTGVYSRIARGAGADVVAIDGDPTAVEVAYRRFAAEGDKNTLPLWIDLTNPAPSHGWAHREWPSLTERLHCDLVLALALVHHLAIGNNVPFTDIADFLGGLGRRVLIEWVPKDDPQVQRLLVSREDVFARYDEQSFVAAFARRFSVARREPLPSSGRVLYLFETGGIG